MKLERIRFHDHLRLYDQHPDYIEQLNPGVFTIWGKIMKETDLFVVVLSQDRDPIFPEVGGPRNAGWLILKSAIIERAPFEVTKS